MSMTEYMRNKYGNKKTVVDGITFASKKEAEYYGYLKLRVKAKEILSFELQYKLPIEINGVKVCTYICDFKINHLSEEEEFIDVKGFKTPEYRLKKKLVLAWLGIEIIEK